MLSKCPGMLLTCQLKNSPSLGTALGIYHISGSGIGGYQYKSVVQSSAEVTDLLPGTEYQVYVASVNAIGTGQYCCVGTPRYVTTYNGKLKSSNS